MAAEFRNGIDLVQTYLDRAGIQQLANDPGSPIEGQIWVNTTENRFKIYLNGAAKSLADLDDVTAGSITGALWDAQSAVIAVADDTPVVQVFTDGQILGKPTGGNITAMTPAQVRTELAVYTQTETESAITTQVDALVNAAPGTLDTLDELAAALGDDPNFATTITNDLAGKASKFAGLIGDGTTTALAVTHNLGTTDVVVSLKDVASSEIIYADITVTSANVVTVTFAVAPTTDAIRVTVLG